MKDDYLAKAQESLKVAKISFEESCYNSSASRSYYAMFQAAIAALLDAGIGLKGNRWNHPLGPS